jgi:hypothetical protein
MDSRIIIPNKQVSSRKENANQLRTKNLLQVPLQYPPAIKNFLGMRNSNLNKISYCDRFYRINIETKTILKCN